MSLLADFVPFQSGFVLLGNTEEDLHTQYKALPPDPGVWQRLTSEGSFCCGGDAAIPIYAAGVLNGLLFLRSVSPGSMPVLSAVASLASVAVESVHETERLRDDCTVLEQRIFGNGGIPGHSPAIHRLLEQIEKLAPRDTTVLIQGESGTGKELVARLLHRGSPRVTAVRWHQLRCHRGLPAGK